MWTDGKDEKEEAECEAMWQRVKAGAESRGEVVTKEDFVELCRRVVKYRGMWI